MTNILLVLLSVVAAPSLLQAAGGGVHGRVLGHDEQGKYLGIVADAQIEFQNRSGGNVAQVASDKNGYYKVDLPPGEYLYKIVARGYRDEDVGRGLRLTRNEGYAVFNLAVTQGENDATRKRPEPVPLEFGKLRGRVLDATTVSNLGIASPGIANARLALRRDGTNQLIHTRSRADNHQEYHVGDYEITLECGTYHASVMAAGFEPFVLSNSIVIRSGIETEQDFALKRLSIQDAKGQGIRGVVTIVDSDRTPPQTKVRIISLRNSLASVEVQHQGSTSFVQDLVPGGYRVIASAEGFPDAESPPVYVMEGRYSQVNLALRSTLVPEPKSSVDVFVYSKSASSDQLIPIPRAHVSLQKTGADDPATTQDRITDKTGHVLFVVNEAGEYVAHAQLDGYRAGHGHGVVTLDQKHEVGVELVKEPTQPPALKLDIQVMDSIDRRPLAGVKLLARLPAQQLSEAVRGVTDSQGHASLLLAQEGTYSVLAQLVGYEPGGTSTTAKRDSSNIVKIPLKKTSQSTVELPTTPSTDVEVGRCRVSGYVAYRESTGQLRAVPETHLIWKRVASTQPAFTKLATTNGNGKYQLELLPGRYEVRVEPAPGFERLTEIVDVISGQQDKYFILHRSTEVNSPPADKLVEVTGQVLTEASPRRFIGVPRAEIVFIHGGGVAKLTSSIDGKFTQRLPVDHYHVQVRAPGYLTINNEISVQADMPALRLILKRTAADTSDDQTKPVASLNLVVVERRPGVAVSPIAGAQVRLLQAGNVLFTGQTNALGQYKVHVKPGAYSLAVSKLGYANSAEEIVMADRDMTHQVVLRGGTPPGGDAVRNSALNIHVSRRALRPSTNIRPISDSVAGAQVMVFRGAQQVGSGLTNANGNFSLSLPAGNYAIKVMAIGLAPAGKTIQLNDRETSVNIQLEGLPGGAAVIDESIPAGARIGSGGKDVRGSIMPQTKYVVEYRMNSRAQWVILGEYSSQREAQAALSRAVERRQIPGAAPAESRIRTTSGHAGVAR